MSETKKVHLKMIKAAILVSILILYSSISSTAYQDKTNHHNNQIPSPILASMTWSQEKGFVLVADKITTSTDTVGWVNFTNAINQTGWSYLEIKTHEHFADKIQVRD